MKPDYKDNARQEIKIMREWLDRLESTCLKEDVFAWFAIEAMLKSANAITYEAGRFNGEALAERAAVKLTTEPEQAEILKKKLNFHV